MGLFGAAESGSLNPAKVIEEILALEGIGQPSRLKPPIQNKHPPLQGLWHKHYLEDGMKSFTTNILRGMDRYGFPHAKRKIEEAKKTGAKEFFTTEDIEITIQEILYEHWKKRGEKQALTGEWLVFAKHGGENYYLGLTTHEIEQHDAFRRQIDAICCDEFPFLSQLLENGARK